MIFDETTDRYDIRFDIADYYGAKIGISSVFAPPNFPACGCGFNPQSLYYRERRTVNAR